QKFEADLIKQSLYDKHLLKELTNTFETEINSIKKEISILTDQIEILKNLRKTKSNALQNWLFTNYTFLNDESEEKSLLDIFKTALHSQPPAGAGECCAPKLFQYAYKNNLNPLLWQNSGGDNRQNPKYANTSSFIRRAGENASQF